MQGTRQRRRVHLGREMEYQCPLVQPPWLCCGFFPSGDAGCWLLAVVTSMLCGSCSLSETGQLPYPLLLLPLPLALWS